MGKKRIIAGAGEDTSAEKKASSPASAPKTKKSILKGIIHVASTFNNTIVSVSDVKGNVFVWTTAGSMGFKGARKSTPYAATIIAKEAIERAKRFGLQEAKVIIKGIGSGRDAALRDSASPGIAITAISDDAPSTQWRKGCQTAKSLIYI